MVRVPIIVLEDITSSVFAPSFLLPRVNGLDAASLAARRRTRYFKD